MPPLNALNNVLVEPFMSNGLVVAFEIGIVLQFTRCLQFSWLDVPQGDPPLRGPFHQLSADLCGSVVDLYGHRLAVPSE